MSTERLNSLPDETLVKLTLAGEKTAYEVLYLRYRGQLMSYYLKKINNTSQAEDLIHKVFLKLIFKLQQFDQTKVFKPWFFTLAYNELIDHFRQDKSYREHLDQYEQQANQTENTNSETDVLEMIQTHPELKDKQKLALELRYLQELSFSGVGKKLGTTSQNARQIISRALKILKQGNKHE